MRQIKVAIASKLRHADFLRKQRLDGFHFNSRWLDTGNLASNAAKPVTHWLRENLDDIEASDMLIGYAEEGEHLKTAIGEIFHAMAHGKPVWLIGDHQDYEPWGHFYPHIRRARSFEQALSEARQMFSPAAAKMEHQ